MDFDTRKLKEIEEEMIESTPLNPRNTGLVLLWRAIRHERAIAIVTYKRYVVAMKALQSRYVLVLDSLSEDTERLQMLLTHLRCACVVMSSTDQLIDVATQAVPYLVLVGGDERTWSPALVEQLRQIKGVCHSTILALTDHHAPSWLLQEQNPGFDGFLVKPLNGEVLTSVIESAKVRHNYSLLSETVA